MKLLSATAYPLAMIAVVWAVCAGLDAGFHPGIVVGALNVAVAGVVLVLERVIPYRAAWNRSHDDVRVDVLHVVSSGAGGEVGRIVAVSVAAACATSLAKLGSAPWPTRWPIAAQLALALPIAELGLYWFHRWCHRGGWLWRIHQIHHSAPRLYFLNSARNHPIDSLIGMLVMVAPLALLGAGERLLTVAIVFWASHALFQHSNADVRLGPLNWVLSMAEVHRFHHSRDLEEANANFGQTLLIWDLVFGTRRVPETPPPEDVGLKDEYPTRWFPQLVAPFRSAVGGPAERSSDRG